MKRVVALILVLVAGAGLYWFQPWKAITDSEVSETLATVPTPASSGPASAEPASSGPASAGPASSGPAAPKPVAAVVRQGEFISHEHDTAGKARVVRGADGSHRLELVGLDTSNGPDLRVWLSDQPVREGVKGWKVFDDGKFVELGKLKGNRGDQAYVIPAGTDLERLASVSIWCKRFAVSFGAAVLAPAA